MNEATKKLVEEAEKRAREFGACAPCPDLFGVDDARTVRALCAEVRRLDEERTKERAAWAELFRAREQCLSLPLDAVAHARIRARERFDEALARLERTGVDTLAFGIEFGL